MLVRLISEDDGSEGTYRILGMVGNEDSDARLGTTNVLLLKKIHAHIESTCCCC